MGVHYDSKRNKWVSQFYKKRLMSRPHQRRFPTKELAEADYQHIKRLWPQLRTGTHDYSGFENRFVKIICLSSIVANDGQYLYLAQNKTDYKYQLIKSRTLSSYPDTAGAPSPYKFSRKGYLEVKRKSRTRYTAIMYVNGTHYSLGVFNTAEEAHQKYVQERDRYYFCPHGNVDAYRTQIIEEWKNKASNRRIRRPIRSIEGEY